MKITSVLKGIGIFFLFCILVGLFGPHDTNTKAVEQQPKVEKVVTLQEQLNDEIPEASLYNVLDSCDIVYNDATRSLMVDMTCSDPWDAEQFRKIMIYNTFDIMEVAVSHSADIDYVFITGYTDMTDQQGNTKSEKVYYAQVPMSRAVNTNWGNLLGYDDLRVPVKNNFESVWWHPGVSG